MAMFDDLKNNEETFRKINEAAVELESTLGAIQQQLKSAAKESEDVADLIKMGASSSKDLAKSAEHLSKANQDSLKTEAQANKLAKQKQELLRKQSRQNAIIAKLEERRLNASEGERESIDKALRGLYDQQEVSGEILQNFDGIVSANDKLKKETKWLDKMSKTFGSIPGLGPLIGDPLKKAGQIYKDARIGDKSLGIKPASKFKSMAKSAGSIADSFGPAMLIKSLLSVDSSTTKLAHTLQMSKDDVQTIKKRFDDIAIGSGKAYLNQKNLIEATSQVSSALGVAKGFQEDSVKNQAFLTKQLGLSVDEAGSFAKYSEFTGKLQGTTNKEIANQVAALQKETGIALKLNDVFREVAKANAGLQAAYGFNNELIAKQVTLTMKIGLNLDQSAKMASQLLDFESSIAKELEAELLTGKDLNLEKARLLALQGKNTEAAAEMARQVGGTAELSRMNVLQQEALANAVGLSRDELIASVQQREILERIGDRSLEQLYAEHGTREAIAAITGEELLKSMEQESAAAKFEAAVIKLQEAFGNMMAGPFGNFIDGLASAMNHAGTLKLLLYGMTAISFGKLLMSLASMGATLATTATGAIATASALSLGIAAIAIVGGIVAMVAAFNSASSSTQAAARS